MSARVSDYSFALPRRFIALRPASPRDSARLLVLHRESGRIEHRVFRDLPEYLSSSDVLIVNDTRVVPARLLCRRRTGGRVKALVVRRIEGNRWHALLGTSRRLEVGESLCVDSSLVACIVGKERDGRWILEFSDEIEQHLGRLGRAPLPPYLKRDETPADLEWYQTVYAQRPGAIAAPTAGLHFTRELLARIESREVCVRRITLHVGVGTFQPVKVENVEEHRMEAERYEIPRETLEALEDRRVVAVGTTTVRALETWARTGQASGETDLFIHPPFPFHRVRAMVTNFHLPKSTLLMLVSAFAGREKILPAYEEAKREGYRFFSYGDAMLIL